LFSVDLDADTQGSDELDTKEPRATEVWYEEMLNPRERITLTRLSDEYDPQKKILAIQTDSGSSAMG
jgi:hypothetical protein